MRIVLLPFALLILAIVGVAAIQAGLVTAGEDITVTNETWTPDAGNVTTLEDSEKNNAYYESNVTVYNETDTEVDQGSDFEWFEGNGTVKALVGGDLDGDANATITYGYALTTEEHQRMAALLAWVPRILGFILPLLAILIFLVFIGGG